MTEDEERILLASVPPHWKDCATPIGAVQGYIAELECAVQTARVSVMEDLQPLLAVLPALEDIANSPDTSDMARRKAARAYREAMRTLEGTA